MQVLATFYQVAGGSTLCQAFMAKVCDLSIITAPCTVGCAFLKHVGRVFLKQTKAVGWGGQTL